MTFLCTINSLDCTHTHARVFSLDFLGVDFICSLSIDHVLLYFVLSSELPFLFQRYLTKFILRYFSYFYLMLFLISNFNCWIEFFYNTPNKSLFHHLCIYVIYFYVHYNLQKNHSFKRDLLVVSQSFGHFFEDSNFELHQN